MCLPLRCLVPLRMALRSWTEQQLTIRMPGLPTLPVKQLIAETWLSAELTCMLS